MSLLSRLVACCRNLFQKKRVERALSDELAHAFEALVENKMSEGASEAEARRWAAMQLGGVEQLKEQVREVSAGYYSRLLYRELSPGCSLRRAHVAKESRVYGHGRGHPCVRYRRQHGCVQRV